MITTNQTNPPVDVPNKTLETICIILTMTATMAMPTAVVMTGRGETLMIEMETMKVTEANLALMKVIATTTTLITTAATPQVTTTASLVVVKVTVMMMPDHAVNKMFAHNMGKIKPHPTTRICLAL